MKTCPRCNRNYADESLNFCLDDGSVLTSPYDPEATIVSSKRTVIPTGTEVVPQGSLSPHKRKAMLPYLIVGLLALIIGGGIATLLISKDKAESQNPTTSAQVESTKPAYRTEETKIITVSAQRMWTDTNVQLKNGDLVEINASGKVNASGVSTDPAYKWVDPDGWGYAPEFKNGETGEPLRWTYVLGPGTSLMCLTGKVGPNGQPFKVGRHYLFTAQENGTLYLGANDVISDYKGNIVYTLDESSIIWPDNGGAFTVNVKRTSTQ